MLCEKAFHCTKLQVGSPEKTLGYNVNVVDADRPYVQKSNFEKKYQGASM